TWIDLRAGGPGNHADINIVVRIDRKTMRRQELAKLGPCRRVAETTNQLALVVDDANPWPEIGDVAAYGSGRTDFADVEDRLMAVRHAEPAGAMQVLPLGLELAVAVEDLDAMVLTVCDVDPTIGVTADVVND